ncbi:PsiF family protein [Robbsia sp. KACC 23696]|uniref:PsiF family protein n=1 Tax=Robbsia sp. KACC 23696 TaxID=3149231 RepID=UPI00325A87EA
MAALGLSLAFGLASTAPAAFAQNSQQNKMTSCNKQASDGAMKGDQRKAFMKSCLSSKSPAAPKQTQQDKMKSCNASATGKTGDARKAYMKDCLSAH